MQIERRSFQTEIRIHEDGDKRTIVGHAAVFNTLSEDLGGFREKIAPGAFKKAIEKDDIRALLNHDPNIILGRNTAGTLRLKEDKKGLAIELDPPDTAAGRDLMVSMERGDITQMSFGFRTIVQEWDESDQNNVVRTLKEVDLFDVSPVVFPAYPQTDVALREYRAWCKSNKPRICRVPVYHRAVDLICSEDINAGGWRQDAAGKWVRRSGEKRYGFASGGFFDPRAVFTINVRDAVRVEVKDFAADIAAIARQTMLDDTRRGIDT